MEELGLESQRQLPELIQVDRAPVYSNCPGLRRYAPVKAPFSCPKNSDSSRSCGIAAQLTLTNGPPRRDETAWMALATRSFPTPLSPRIKTVASVSAIFSMTVPTARIWGPPSRNVG